MRAVVVSSFDLRRVNGGTLRVLAIADSLRRLGWDVLELCPEDQSVTAISGISQAPGRQYVSGRPIGQRSWPKSVRALKRVVAPLPTVSGAYDRQLLEAATDSVAGGDLLVVPFPFAAHIRTDANLWVDFHDLNSRYAAREARHGSKRQALGAFIQGRVFRRQEIRLASRADYVTAAGFVDAQELDKRVEHGVIWMPNPVKVVKRDKRDSYSRTAGMIADFRYGPNIEARKTLIESWWPILASEGWNLVIAGHDSTRGPTPHGVKSLGYVESPRAFYESIDISLAPLRLGGGIKVKIIESLGYGVPVIASPFAVEGLRSPEAAGVIVVASGDDLRRQLKSMHGAGEAIALPWEYSLEAIDNLLTEMLAKEIT